MKRVLDLGLSLLGLCFIWPLLAVVAALIVATDGWPILFLQQRVGRGGKPFRIWKFRTMVRNAEQMGKLLTVGRDPRITWIGHWLRKTKLDELPQLFNVIRGEMSLIGPRPAIPYEVDVYREWHRRRFEAPPGITGLWQVSGRNRLTFDEMIKLDIDYLENWSFLLDLQILWRTVRVVLFEHAY
jgi:lipopolysaccharide/colanic/teichoic acid biosynthesis glycosyltransferase